MKYRLLKAIIQHLRHEHIILIHYVEHVITIKQKVLNYHYKHWSDPKQNNWLKIFQFSD